MSPNSKIRSGYKYCFTQAAVEHTTDIIITTVCMLYHVLYVIHNNAPMHEAQDCALEVKKMTHKSSLFFTAGSFNNVPHGNLSFPVLRWTFPTRKLVLPCSEVNIPHGHVSINIPNPNSN